MAVRARLPPTLQLASDLTREGDTRGAAAASRAVNASARAGYGYGREAPSLPTPKPKPVARAAPVKPPTRSQPKRRASRRGGLRVAKWQEEEAQEDEDEDEASEAMGTMSMVDAEADSASVRWGGGGVASLAPPHPAV